NLLGPLANPARAPRQLLGVYASALVPVVAETLARLGTERALVVHGLEGLDEISPSGPTRAAWVEAGHVPDVVLHPEDGGLRAVPRGALQGGTPEENALLLAGVLDGRGGPLRDAVLLNAGAALWVADAVQTLAEGVLRAAESIDSGAARVRLERLITFSRAGVAAGIRGGLPGASWPSWWPSPGRTARSGCGSVRGWWPRWRAGHGGHRASRRRSGTGRASRSSAR